MSTERDLQEKPVQGIPGRPVVNSTDRSPAPFSQQLSAARPLSAPRKVPIEPQSIIPPPILAPPIAPPPLPPAAPTADVRPWPAIPGNLEPIRQWDVPRLLSLATIAFVVVAMTYLYGRQSPWSAIVGGIVIVLCIIIYFYHGPNALGRRPRLQKWQSNLIGGVGIWGLLLAVCGWINLGNRGTADLPQNPQPPRPVTISPSIDQNKIDAEQSRLAREAIEKSEQEAATLYFNLHWAITSEEYPRAAELMKQYLNHPQGDKKPWVATRFPAVEVLASDERAVAALAALTDEELDAFAESGEIPSSLQPNDRDLAKPLAVTLNRNLPAAHEKRAAENERIAGAARDAEKMSQAEQGLKELRALGSAIFGARGETTAEPAARADHRQATLKSNDGTDIFVCKDSKTRARLVDLCVAHDTIGVADMVGSGRVFVVKSGTSVQVIKRGWSLTEVRMMGGEHAFRSGFVSGDDLH